MGCIYALATESEPERFFYVGQTTQAPDERLRQHRNEYRWGGRTAKNRRVEALTASGEEIIMKVLEDNLPRERLGWKEIDWYRELVASGHALTNDPGALGSQGKNLRPQPGTAVFTAYGKVIEAVTCDGSLFMVDERMMMWDDLLTALGISKDRGHQVKRRMKARGLLSCS